MLRTRPFYPKTWSWSTMGRSASTPAKVLTLRFSADTATHLTIHSIVDCSVEVCLPTFHTEAADRAHVAYMPDAAWPRNVDTRRLIPSLLHLGFDAT